MQVVAQEVGGGRQSATAKVEFYQFYVFIGGIDVTMTCMTMIRITKVVVNLVDMNDNLPVFEKEEYRVTIRENIAPGTKVVQVRPDFKINFNKIGRLGQGLSI